MPGTDFSQTINAQMDAASIILLGKPGSGKTTLLLELTRELLTRAEQEREYLIPVVFRLSSWKGKEKSFVQWLTEELHSKYQLPLEVGRTWIEADNITLLLDGLDEIDHEKQQSCIQAINTYHEECPVFRARREEDSGDGDAKIAARLWLIVSRYRQ
jgi:predicted NACHT family NTPase